MNRNQRAALAQDSLQIFETGEYTAPSGKTVTIQPALAQAIAATRLYRPTDFPAEFSPNSSPQVCKVEVTQETTLAAARRLAEDGLAVCCLNFASAKNPGGGFLSGSQAQEESLARASGLYACLLPMQEYYDYHRQLHSGLYSDHMIFSPAVPVFRDDADQLLEHPYLTAFLTSPAVNAGSIRKNEPEKTPLIEPTLKARLHKLLWLAQSQGQQNLILGAWGCGVFGNQPESVARLFAEALGPTGPFYGSFSRIVYAIYDRTESQKIYRAFEFLRG